MRVAALLSVVSLVLTSVCPALRAEPADSVVKVTAFTRFPDPTRPWEKAKPVEGGGSGVYIGNKRILTNAHVVNYASELYVQWNQAGDKVDAKIEALSVDLDLAVLSVADEKFFDKRKPMLRAKKLPRSKDGVTVYGFPRGGAGMSVTKGEVSRINAIQYGAEGFGLQIQISAPVNRGNSGGPAVAGENMVGLVYSSLIDAQNIGYIIPIEEIDHFLNHIKDGRYTGKPRINTLTRYQGLENDSLRRMLRIDRSVQGVLILRPTPDVPLKEFDIITKIGDHPIDNKGLIQVEPDVNAFFMYMVPRLARGNSVPVTVRRDGKLLGVNLPVQYEDPLVVKRYRGEQLPYFIHGPLVFVTAKSEDIGDFYYRLNPFIGDGPLTLRRDDYVRFPGEELVVVSSQFRHKITNGYVDHGGKVVKAINETPIKNLRHLVETLRDSRGEFLKIEFAEKSSGLMVFDRGAIEDATEQIIEEIGIAPTRRGSADLMAVWRAKKKGP